MGGADRSKLTKTAIYCLLATIYAVLCVYFNEWMPKCIFHLISGYDCPACGTQRALKYFAEGDFRAGFFSNPYIVVLLPYIFTVAVAEFGGRRTENLKRAVTDYRVIIVLGVVMLGWWIFRNTDFWHTVMINNGLR